MAKQLGIISGFFLRTGGAAGFELLNIIADELHHIHRGNGKNTISPIRMTIIMTILAPGRPQTASSDAPMGTPSTPPVQNLRCPQANSILTVCQGYPLP